MIESREILKKIPHRHPFVFVDRILHLEPGRMAVAIKNVTVNERHFTGHFPDRPILPGVLIAESMAQVGGIIAQARPGEEEAGGTAAMWYLAEIKDFRFRRPVVPGEQMVITVEVEKAFGNLVRFNGRAVVGDEVRAEGSFTLGKTADNGPE